MGRDAITTICQHKYGETQVSCYQFQSADQSANNTSKKKIQKKQLTTTMAVKVFRVNSISL